MSLSLKWEQALLWPSRFLSQETVPTNTGFSAVYSRSQGHCAAGFIEPSCSSFFREAQPFKADHIIYHSTAACLYSHSSVAQGFAQGLEQTLEKTPPSHTEIVRRRWVSPVHISKVGDTCARCSFATLVQFAGIGWHCTLSKF